MSGISGIQAALYGGLGGGLIGGVFAVIGVVVDRLLRLTGRLRFAASVSSLMLTGVEDAEGYERSVPLAEADEKTEAGGSLYVFEIDLFNGMEVPTGLRRVRVELVRDDGECLESRPYDVEDRLLGLDVINLAPRQFRHLELHEDAFGKDAADILKAGRWERIDFVGERPKRPFLGILGGKTYRKTITHRIAWLRR